MSFYEPMFLMVGGILIGMVLLLVLWPILSSALHKRDGRRRNKHNKP